MKYRIYLLNPIHISWLIMWVSVGLLLGIVCAPWLTLFEPIQSILIAIAMLFVVLRSRIRAVVVLALLAGVFLGHARGVTINQDTTSYEPLYGSTVTLTGTVREDTSIGPQGDQRVRLRTITIQGMHYPGDIWFSTATREVLKRSDIVTIRGELNEGFGTLSATMFRASIVTVERPAYADIPRDVRDWFGDNVRTAVPEPEASLGIGYLTGQRSTLPQELEEELRILGLTHVVVASGYNLTILVRFSRRAFAKKSKYLATLAAGTMICGFVLVTGFSPSMSRAALVAGLSLLAWYFGRSAQPLVILAFSAAVTALINPAYVWGDIGWYLSFTSFAGIMLLAPLFTHFFWGSQQPRMFSRIIVETMSAQLATLPIIALIFGQYSPLALPANLLVLPLIPLTMLLTFFAGIGAVSLPGFALWIGLPATAVLSYMTFITGWLANTPWARAEVSFSLTGLIVSYALLIGAGIVLWRITKHRFSKDNIVV